MIIACSHRYCRFTLLVSHRECILCYNCVQRAELDLYVRGSRFINTLVLSIFYIIIIVIIIIIIQASLFVLTSYILIAWN